MATGERRRGTATGGEPAAQRRGASGLLRAVVLGLVLANLVFFLWARGLLALFGWVPAEFHERQPYRLERQVRPGAMVLPAASGAAVAPSANASASAPRR